MRETVAFSQRVHITLRYLTTGNNVEDVNISKIYVSVNWNYCAGDVFTSRQTDDNWVNIEQYCP